MVDIHVDLFKAYLKLLYKVNSKNPDTLLREASAMNTIFEKEVYPLEWICKVFVDRINDTDFDTISHLDKSIEFYSERLLAMSPNSTLGLMTQSIHLCQSGQFLKAKETLLKGILIDEIVFYCNLITLIVIVNDLQRNWHVCLAWLAQVNYHLGSYSVSEILLRIVPDKNVRILIECLVGQAEIDNKPIRATEAVQLCAEMLPNVLPEHQTDFIYLLAR